MPVLTGRVARGVGRRAVVAAVRELEAVRPRDAEALHAFVLRVFGVDVPRVARVAGSDPPFEYLVHAFFEGEVPLPASTQALGEVEGGAPSSNQVVASADVVVWACRGGGKTFLGAVATMLDLLFKPGVQVRVLAGTREQSSRMFEHLVSLASRRAIAPLLLAPPTQVRVALVNGSRAELLAHTETSVRGQRVQKLRCDEVEEFNREVWGAAQLTTRSATLGGRKVRGAVEALSTMHQPYGLMQEVTRQKDVRVLKWTAVDVAATCEPERDCETCRIRADCNGLAKTGTGFVPIEDLLRQRERIDDGRWDAEMMCRRPTRSACVYPEFDPRSGGKHVMEVGVEEQREEETRGFAALRTRLGGEGVWLAGIDFGTRNPLAMVWARFWPGRQGEHHVGAPTSDPRLGLIEIVDEHCEEGLLLDHHLRLIEAKGWPRPSWLGVDPAGGARNGQTGISDIAYLQRRGYVVRKDKGRIEEGVAIIRRRLDRGTLRIDPRCGKLIRSLSEYHYDTSKPTLETPVKDGHDHLCDALRYLMVNLEWGPMQTMGGRDYL